MKTFISVSSGRLEKDDKLILTTDSIFDIFSLEEIKKSSLRFSARDFVQFLKTALGSELERAAVLIVDFKDQKEIAQDEIFDSSNRIPEVPGEKPISERERRVRGWLLKRYTWKNTKFIHERQR